MHPWSHDILITFKSFTKVWENILEVSKMDALSNILSVHLIKWLSVLVTPCNLPVDCSLLIGPLSGGQVSNLMSYFPFLLISLLIVSLSRNKHQDKSSLEVVLALNRPFQKNRQHLLLELFVQG